MSENERKREEVLGTRVRGEGGGGVSYRKRFQTTL